MDAINTVGVDNLNKKSTQKADFKMVTFSLAGKDYGIDILKVKEISKVDKFTYVPNTYPYVLGVHNLRGDIVSLIDMRKMFSLPLEKDEKLLNVVIIHVNEFFLGIVVDGINKVVAVSRDNIQLPPALLSDINIKYLSGVIEYNENLYLILDVDRIFPTEETPAFETRVVRNIPVPETLAKPLINEASVEFNFIVETLATFRNFFVSGINRIWVEKRFKDWKSIKEAQGQDFQLKNESEADEYLAPFYSENTGRLWDIKLKNILDSVLPTSMSGTLNVWNCGCARGYEAYSLAVILRLKYPREIMKIWANDYDLLSISTAPNLVFKEIELPDYIKKSNFLEPCSNGLRFKKEIKDLIYFEFHDTLHSSTMPDIDIIIARDIISFQTQANQKKILSEFFDNLKNGGMFIIGDNEIIEEPGWSKMDISGMNIYRKEQR